MDKMELENAAKSIFIQCLNEPDILETIKAKLNYVGETCDSVENQIQKPNIRFNEYNTSKNEQLIQKIDEILKCQKRIEELIKSEPNQGTKKIEEQNRNLIVENQNLKNEIIKLKDENKTIEEKCRIEISNYTIFEEALEVWNCINALNYENRGYIESLCGSLNILAILSLGRDDGKIEQLWLYLRNMAVKGDIDKIEVSKLNRYFEFCLKVANTSKSEHEKYVIFDIELESEFDMDTCIRTVDSKQVGKIKDIVVKSVKVGKYIKFKAIVRVG